MTSALVVELAEEPWVPGSSKTLVTAGTQPAAVMGSPEFKPVFFDFDKYDIKPEFVAVIKENAGVLKGDANMKVVIEGHCDERGTTEYNLALGERRARAVRSALIDEGVNPTQLKMVSYGEERPADLGHNEAAWEKNRRAVIVIPQ
ncbi:MAG: peptidoglycan-associated lipoprotein Pal [Candidatus Lambdaproteobacteria bacterium]|nr:peptidoglycan-associated lipoprotein Pal [Candidatus Lambdaproteobacteria bacterium]